MIAASLLALPVARGSVITFSDTTFNPYNSVSNPGGWTDSTVSVPAGGTTSAVQQATNGETGGPDLLVSVNVPGSIPTGAAVYAFNLYNAATWDPATQGPITSLIFSESRKTDSTGQEFGPAIEQGGVFYYSDASYLPSTSWSTLTTGALTSSNFGTATTSNGPNFTATGGPMTFGFVAINSTSDTTGFSTSALYDNYSISLTVTPTGVPEPASIGLLGICGLVLCRRKSRPNSATR